MTPHEIMNIEMQENDAGAKTIGEYIAKLACGVIVETEGFSGKRPFGNSGWYMEIVSPLVREGVVSGDFEDDDGYYAYGYNSKEVDKVLTNAINEVFKCPA